MRSVFGRDEIGCGQPPRFVLASQIVYNLGYKECSDFYTWVPIFEIYDRYKEEWQGRPHDNQSPTLLCRAEFGQLIERLFSRSTATTLRTDKKRVRGREGLSGPGERHRRKPSWLTELVNDRNKAENERNTK